MTRIIMTEVTSPLCKYTKFNIKGTGRLVASVDRRDGRYIIFGGYTSFSELARRTKKASAIQFAQEYIRGFLPDAEFKWNVMREKYRLA